MGGPGGTRQFDSQKSVVYRRRPKKICYENGKKNCFLEFIKVVRENRVLHCIPQPRNAMRAPADRDIEIVMIYRLLHIIIIIVAQDTVIILA